MLHAKQEFNLNLAKEADRKKFIQVLTDNNGRINVTRFICGVSKTTLHRYRKKYKDFDDEVENLKGSQIDYVESKLFDLIDEGNCNAIIFYLKTRGRDRGYGEKYVPETEKKTEPHKVDEKIPKQIEKNKAKLTELLKQRGMYSDYLVFQIDLTATLFTKLQLMKDEIFDKNHHTVITEKSREGNNREVASPLDSQFRQYLAATQAALRALGLNTDSKQKIDFDDGFDDFMNNFKAEKE